MPLLVDILELLLKSSPPNMNHEYADEDGRSHHSQAEEHELLEGVERAEVEGVEAGQGHGTCDQE